MTSTPAAGADHGTPVVTGPTRTSTPVRSGRATTDLWFAVLVAAVLASSVVALGVLYLASSGAERLFRDQVAPCLTRAQAVAAALPGTVLQRAEQGTALARQCQRPQFREQAVWIGAGLTAELAVAGLLYTLHPWWLVRRRRLTPLAGPGNTDVRSELDRLAGEAGVARPPVWLLDPYAATHGGQAFGLPGRRRVCLDVGLVVRFDLDRPGFRAVVRHELAHLHNRDVDRAYLTIAIWWSCVLVALSPFVVLSVNPDLLLRPLTWSMWDVTAAGGRLELFHRLAALVVLTTVVYLARNATLRTRELHADVVAARWDAPDGALARVVGSLPWPPPRGRWRAAPARWRHRWARVGTHPAPALRVAGIADPRRLTRTGGWDSAGQGLIFGLVLNNISLFAVNLFGSFFSAGMALLALPVGVLLVVLLIRAVWAGAVDGGPRRDPVRLAIAMALGFAASGPLSLVAVDRGLSGASAGGFLLSTALLGAGAVALAAWVWSLFQIDGGRPSAVRRPPIAVGRRPLVVLTTAVAVGAPSFALWYVCTLGQYLDRAQWGGRTREGSTIGWYATLADWTGVLYAPRIYLSETPVASAGLVLLWAVPAVLLGWWRRGGEQPAGVARALVIGGVAGVGVLVLGMALPVVAGAVLPLNVRSTPAHLSAEDVALGMPLYFFQVHHNTYLALAALAQAVAAAAVAAGRARLRPVLVPLAVTTTAVVATAGHYANQAVSTCVELTGPTSRPCGPRLLLPDAFLAAHLHGITSWGILAAVPAALLGAGLATWWRRVRARDAGVGTPGKRAGPTRTVTASSAGVLAAMVFVGAAAAVPAYYRFWGPDPVAAVSATPPRTPTATPELPAPLPDRPTPSGPTPDPPTPSGPTSDGPTPSGPTIDPCVIGAWRETVNESDQELFGGRHRFTGSGFTQTFRADGVVTVDAGSGVRLMATIDGQRVELLLQGRITARYRTDHGTIRYADVRAEDNRVTLTVDGVARESSEFTGDVSADRYRCAGDTMSQVPADPKPGEWARVLLQRTGPGN